MNERLDIVVYSDGELELKASIANDTLWLTQKQLSELFDVETQTVNYHIKNILKQKELEKYATIRKIRIVQKEGNRDIQRDVEHYNLDMIISLGYRVNSITATKFRQWATSILKKYIHNGYTINAEKITTDRFVSLENDVHALKSQMTEVNVQLKKNSAPPKQGIFYNGEVFDAYVFINSLLQKSTQSIILIDNYIDENVLLQLSTKTSSHVKITIFTKTLSKALTLDLQKHNKQYTPIRIVEFPYAHDRFLIIDEKEVYHLGASLKDLGKKWFAFSKLDAISLSFIEKIKDFL